MRLMSCIYIRCMRALMEWAGPFTLSEQACVVRQPQPFAFESRLDTAFFLLLNYLELAFCRPASRALPGLKMTVSGRIGLQSTSYGAEGPW